jgi:hypothetical protein
MNFNSEFTDVRSRKQKRHKQHISQRESKFSKHKECLIIYVCTDRRELQEINMDNVFQLSSKPLRYESRHIYDFKRVLNVRIA